MKKFLSYPISLSLFMMCWFLLVFNTSCVSKTKINYFQNNTANDTTSLKNENYSYTPIFKIDDFISVDVTALNEESIKPFILSQQAVPANQVPSYTNGIAARSGYLIDANGEITLPIIGKVKLAGLNRIEATELIQDKLSEYVQNPVVNLRIQNFKITVLGDVKTPGSYNIPNERITILEAIGIAGDLNMTGVRKNVMVIRHENEKKTQYNVDLTSKNVFNSPVYYLQQNDVIYVQPNRPKRNSSMISSTAGVLVSITSLIITTINLVTK